MQTTQLTGLLGFFTETCLNTFNDDYHHIRVSEFPSGDPADPPGVLSVREIPNEEVGQWLQTREKLRLCIVWIVWSSQDHNPFVRRKPAPVPLDIHTDAYFSIVEDFGIKDVLNYGNSDKRESSITLTSFAKKPTGIRKRCIYTPNMILAWSEDLATGNVAAVCCTNEDRTADIVLKVCEKPWQLSQHVSFLPFICIANRLYEMRDVVTELHDQVTMTEGLTKIHNYDGAGKLLEEVQRDQWIQASTKTSGIAGKLAFLRHQLKAVQISLDEECAAVDQHIRTPLMPEDEPVIECAVVLKNETAIVERDLTLISDRIQIQLQSLFNLVTLKESATNTEIAAANIAIAQLSADIAKATKRDSTAMKALAVVTVVFLPGTYVAALFATPFFRIDETNGAVRVRSGFSIYWAVTVPLTVGVISVLVGAWFWWLRKDEREGMVDVESAIRGRAKIGIGSTYKTE